jgi:hypothetical protein
MILAYFRIGGIDAPLDECFWVRAGSDKAAREAVAAAVPRMEFAADPLIYECVADSLHTPRAGEVVDGKGRVYVVPPPGPDN